MEKEQKENIQNEDLAKEKNNQFQICRELFFTLKENYKNIDTLSLGMSSDYSLAISCGSTMVRIGTKIFGCLLYTSPSPRDLSTSRMPSSA